MSDGSDNDSEAPTRRDYVKYGGTIVGGGLLAGCASDERSGSTPNPAETESDAGSPTATDTSTKSGSYSVTMEPVGTVEFEDVPTNALTYYPISADALLALGHGDSITAIGYDKQLFGNTVDYYYDSLEGVSFEWEQLGRVTPEGSPDALDRELFYELDNDVHFLDPCLLQSPSFGWSDEEVSAVGEDVGPWFGNYYSRTNAQPPEACRDHYEHLDLWTYIGKISEVVREQERYRAFKSTRGDLLGEIESSLPASSERPSVAVVAYSGGTFWPYDFRQAGYLWDHLRPFGARNAFETTDGPGEDGSYDFEGLIEAEPDIVLRYWGTALGDSFPENRAEVLENSLANDVPAFRNGRYYPSGNGMQEPVMNLFQLEMTAKQLYPETFGEWPGFGDGERYPEIPDDEQLFDRDRVTEIVNGAL